jgi:hypothetical protein
MEEMGYVWFSIRRDGSLRVLQPDYDLRDTNLVAVPNEQTEAMQLATKAGSDVAFERD